MSTFNIVDEFSDKHLEEQHKNFKKYEAELERTLMNGYFRNPDVLENMSKLFWEETKIGDFIVKSRRYMLDGQQLFADPATYYEDDQKRESAPPSPSPSPSPSPYSPPPKPKLLFDLNQSPSKQMAFM